MIREDCWTWGRAKVEESKIATEIVEDSIEELILRI